MDATSELYQDNTQVRMVDVYRQLTDPNTYGISPSQIAEIRKEHLEGIEHHREEADSIFIASHNPLLNMFNGQMKTVGRFYLALSDANALRDLVASLKSFGVIYTMKISKGQRMDQIVIYVDAKNLGQLPDGGESPFTSLENATVALVRFYRNHKDSVVTANRAFTQVIVAADGEELTGVNFTQANGNQSLSPTEIRANIIATLKTKGTYSTEAVLNALEAEGYDANNPGILKDRVDRLDFANILRSSKAVYIPTTFKI